MDFEISFFILLFCSVKYILTEKHLYVLKDVGSITNGKITKYTEGEIKTTCLLKCRNDENCDKSYFKVDKVDNTVGECWYVKEGGEDKLQLPQTSDGRKVKVFQEVPYCDTNNPCKYGRCENTNNGTQYKCRCNDTDWKLQAKNICFGAKDNSYGNFSLTHTGILTKLKLEHTGEATLNCDITSGNIGTRWGCEYYGPQNIWTLITDKNDNLIFPFLKTSDYFHPGYNRNSPYLKFDNLNTPARRGDELRIWYGEDLINRNEHINAGRSCANVYAVFCD
ncbi:uncharacterized protein LOC130625872 [Hydractinia symbiolongicarpus]|uniref:uncharacterized protein LOC130625872 n=1 Tax=Hydractinia symbiolongicarpus TaxID=13093 RepID=UPI00254DEBAE|nr:uncharacterized protein LOC130625872 [Hydractinia symbiolongicarpus]